MSGQSITTRYKFVSYYGVHWSDLRHRTRWCSALLSKFPGSHQCDQVPADPCFTLELMTKMIWHYARNGVKFGPVTSTELKRLASSGNLAPNDLVWKDGMNEWRPAIDV